MNQWTYEEEQELIDLRYQGVPIIQVAQILNRTVDSCRKKHWKLLHEAYTPRWYKKMREHESGREGNESKRSNKQPRAIF